jgi:hypothetical protein
MLDIHGRKRTNIEDGHMDYILDLFGQDIVCIQIINWLELVASLEHLPHYSHVQTRNLLSSGLYQKVHSVMLKAVI